MKFYLMRHAEAESGEQMDPTRELTSIGWKQIPIMADFLKTQTNKIALIMHSEFTRGKDTAEELGKLLDVETMQTPALGPGAKVRRAWDAIQDEIEKLNDGDELLVVSHGPLINLLMALLLESGEGDKFHFSHASIAHLDTETPLDTEDPGDQPCYLHWFVTAKLVNRMMEDNRKAIIEVKRVAAAALRVVAASVDVAAGQTRSARLQEAVDDGDEEKQWVGGTCEVCMENADAGWIPIDDEFPSGDDEPPAHPNCSCELETRIIAESV